MSDDRIEIYVEQLSDLSERQIQFAFVKALRECKFIPQIAELREWAAAGAIELQRKEATTRTRTLLGRADKPDDWNPRLDEAWAEVERFEAQQELEDLAFVEVITDEQALRKPFPGPGRWVDWARRKEARDRRAAGTSRPAPRARYGGTLDRLMPNIAIREPGDES